MTTPFQFFSYEQGILTSEGVSLLEIARSVGTPTYVYSAQGFLEPLQVLKKELAEIDHMVCFAVKANSNIAVLQLLAAQGAGVDLVSGGELFRAEKANIPGNRIVFSGVGKSSEEIKMALQYGHQGIYSFNVESVAELARINSLATELELKARVALRFNPDINPKTHPYISTGLKRNKFGMNLSEIHEIVNKLPTLTGIQLEGISIHIGSQLLSLDPIEESFIKLKNLVTDISPQLATPLSFVDLGGGLGITYKNEKIPTLKRYCHLIKKHFGKSHRKTQSIKPLRVLLEPGRTLSGNAGVLLTKVEYRKKRKSQDFLIVDAGMNDLLRPALYESHHEIVPVKQTVRKQPLVKTSLFGPVCESSDCFARDRQLPVDCAEGDILAILSAGAYGFSMASQYNSRTRPAEVLIQANAYKTIRTRETLEDLVRGEKF